MSAKTPKLALRVLYVSTAGRRIVSVEPKNGNVTIGDESWTVGRGDLLPGKGKFDCICVSGQSRALPVWEKTAITATEWDTAINDNLLRQIKELAQGGRTQAVSWIQVGISALLLLSIIGVGVKLNGDFEEIHKTLVETHPPVEPYEGEDRTTVGSSGQTTGSLGTLQQQQQQGG